MSFLSLGDQRDYQIMSLDKFLVGFFFIFFHNFHLKNILKLSWKGEKRQSLKSVLQSSELLKQSDSNLHSHLYSGAGYLNSDSFSGFFRWNRFFLDLKMEKMTLSIKFKIFQQINNLFQGILITKNLNKDIKKTFKRW